ncbi:cytochrome P450 [Hyphobacterium sp. HN65]|uniref:Cytochrome P450 n=1 Tax=Hyphobacterium lacteum TaxID=3116575 RepID=A0ABU7LQX5_9PROT|nr:cytochrome P450 [Hyphobacterium sp. HN65]MEE2526290.1 cytochrome P450 [Hyphobacterium sp. HN65]
MLRHSPVEILPQEAFLFTRISAPFLGRTIHTLSGPEELKAVLADDPDAWRKSPLIQRILRPILGNAILTAHGDWWKIQRKAMQPGFVRLRIQALIPDMSASAEAAADSLLQADGPVDVTPALNHAALSVIEAALFTRPDNFDRAKIRAAIESVFEETGRTRFSDLLPLPESAPRILGPKALNARKILRDAVAAEIARRRGGETRDDLLQLLLEAQAEDGRFLSDIDVRDNVLSLVIAGHETTAIAIGWALYILARRPDWQDRVRDEVMSIAGDHPLEAHHLPQLVFARQIIHETLRLYPPAPLIGRQAIRNTQICEREVKKGDVALLAFYALHRHHRYWPEPDVFDPERFSLDNRPSDPWQFKPFGGGPRACIGSGFALTEAVIILSSLVRRCRFSVPDGYEPYPVMTVTLRPEGGLPLNVEKR